MSKAPAPRSSGQLPDAGLEYVEFESRGAVLVCGPAALAVPAGKRLAETLRVVVCATDTVPQSDLRANPVIMRGRIARISGYLGRFEVEAWAGEGRTADIGPFSGNPDSFFDLVLDLNPSPLLPVEIKPPGYHAPGTGPQALAAAIADLATLTGSFRKPLGIKFDEAKCAHRSQGVRGCSHCLTVCPAGAIASEAGRIKVAAQLCQGCAICAMACPTGALSSPGSAIAAAPIRLGALLEGCNRAEIARSRLVIHEAQDESAAGPRLPDTLFLALPAIGMAGPELWLAALAQGISQVILRFPPGLPASSRTELIRQVSRARAILTAIGELPERIALGDGENAVPASRAETGDFPPLPIQAWENRRDLFHAALQCLQSMGNPLETGAAAALPEDMPVGTVELQDASCTLCMACAHVCPTGALRSNEANSGLTFVEGKCVQCHICERACPERAISLKPRLLLDPAARHATRPLKAAIRQFCQGCHAPFAGGGLLSRNRQALATPGVLNAERLARLHYCPNCRLRHLRAGLPS